MEKVLSIPYLQTIILNKLNTTDIYHLSCINKNSHENISLYCYNEMNQWIQKFFKRLSCICKLDEINTTQNYLTLYIYYYYIIEYYKSLSNKDKQKIQNNKLIFILYHIKLPGILYPNELTCVYNIMDHLYKENIYNEKLKKINGPYILTRKIDRVQREEGHWNLKSPKPHWPRFVKLAPELRRIRFYSGVMKFSLTPINLRR